MIYTITLNPALDYVMQVDSLRYDDINRSAGETLCFGGKGVNVSAVLTRLGIENTALGFAAGFTGRQLEAMLREEGIRCDFDYLASGNTRINVKINADTELEFNAAGPAVGEQDAAKLLNRLDGLHSGDVLVLSGSVPATVPADIYERMAERVSGKEVKVAVDAAGELLLRVLPYRPFLIKPNHHELGDLFGAAVETAEQAAAYAAKLQALGARNVLVSRAENGALLLDETGRVTAVGNAPGRLVNSVGCGDSMLAGFLAGYLRTGDYRCALRLGTACGNATAYARGLAEQKDIDRLLQQPVSEEVW